MNSIGANLNSTQNTRPIIHEKIGEVSLGRTCPRGENCTYAHGFNELRITNKGLSNRENYSFNAGGFDGMLSTAGNMLSMTTIGSGGAGFLTGSLSATNVPSSTMLIDANAAPSAAAALMAAQRAVQIPTVVPPTNIPSPSDPTAITTLIAVPPNVDATAGALIPAAAAAGPAPSIVNAIDSTTGEIVNLIPVQNVVAQPTVTAVERVNNMPGNFAMESISLVPAVLMPSQPASFAGDSIIEQQMQQAPNILLLNQPGLIQLRPDTVSDVAAACNSSILLMPPNVQQIPAGFPIPMGAIPIRPPVQANVVVGSLSAVHPNPASPPSAIIPGLMMGTQQNFWTNDSCAKFDSGDESFFAKLSAISQPFSSTIYGHIDNDVNKNPFSVENNFENQYSSRRRSFGVNTIEHNTVQDKSDLLIRRHEIISHLAEIRPSSKILEDFFDDELENHVSYTVANSVLFDEKESYFNSGIDLPPLPVGSFKALEKKSSAPFLYNTLSTNFTNNAKNSSPAAKSSTYLRTACANTLPLNISASMATVQSGCKNVVKDAIEQPLIVSSLQSINFFPQIGDESLNPTRLAEKLPPVIKPLSDRAVSDPQDLVAHSIDRIIDVKERIKDSSICNGVIASAVEKEQLKVELGIANRQITTLDEKTKESCLLKELQVVEKQIENLSIVA